VLFAAVRVVEVAGAEVIFTAAVNVSFASAAVCVTVIKVLTLLRYVKVTVCLLRQ